MKTGDSLASRSKIYLHQRMPGARLLVAIAPDGLNGRRQTNLSDFGGGAKFTADPLRRPDACGQHIEMLVSQQGLDTVGDAGTVDVGAPGILPVRLLGQNQALAAVFGRAGKIGPAELGRSEEHTS